jgi:hypothetical protein
MGSQALLCRFLALARLGQREWCSLGAMNRYSERKACWVDSQRSPRTAETDLLHGVSIRFLIVDLIRSETAVTDHLLEGNTTFGVLAEVLARGGNGVTVFVG